MRCWVVVVEGKEQFGDLNLVTQLANGFIYVKFTVQQFSILQIRGPCWSHIHYLLQTWIRCLRCLALDG